jgi:DNA-directed RNA polymerase omega subunit
MYPIPIEASIPKSGGCVYKLARMAALRAIELSEGQRPLVKKDYPSEKLTSTALKEIAAGRVVAAEVAEQELNTEPMTYDVDEVEESQDTDEMLDDQDDLSTVT